MAVTRCRKPLARLRRGVHECRHQARQPAASMKICCPATCHRQIDRGVGSGRASATRRDVQRRRQKVAVALQPTPTALTFAAAVCAIAEQFRRPERPAATITRFAVNVFGFSMDPEISFTVSA